MADDKSISAAQRGNPVPIILLIPYGRRPLKVELPPAVASGHQDRAGPCA